MDVLLDVFHHVSPYLGSEFPPGSLKPDPRIAITQYIGIPLYVIHRDSYYRYMAHTKKAMALLILSMTQWWTTTRVYITSDESMRHQVRQLKDGRVEYGFPERLVLMSNHHVLITSANPPPNLLSKMFRYFE